MSASREKKQRQGGDAYSKSSKSQNEAAVAKRKTIEYTVIGVVVVILVAALLIWNSGFFQRRATALTVGDTKYSVAEVNYYYYSALQYEYMLSQYGMSQFDSKTDPADQVYNADDGTTYRDYFLQTAEDNLKSITALYDEAIKQGYTEADVKDTVQSSMDSMKENATSNGYSSLKQYLVAAYGKYMTVSSYKQFITRSALANLYQSDYTDSLTYTDTQYQDYYKENADTLDTYHYAYLYFPAAEVSDTDDSGNTRTDDEKAALLADNMTAAKKLADSALADIQSSGDVAAAISKYVPDSSDPEASSTGSSLSAYYSEWLEDSSRKEGDSTVLEATDTGYYVVVFQSRELVEDPTVNCRHILIKAETPTDDTSTTDVDESTGEPTADAMAAAKTKAEDILAEWKAGDATEDSFAKLAEKYSEDTGSNTNGGLYENVYEGQFISNFNDWIFDSSRKEGDTTVVENDQSGSYGYHVIYFQSWAIPCGRTPPAPPCPPTT